MAQPNPDRQDPFSGILSESSHHFSVEEESRVAMHDALILGRFNWSLAATRILMALVSQLRPEEYDHFTSQILKVRDLAYLADQEYGSWYEEARRITRSLGGEVVEIQAGRKGWQRIPLFKSVRYLDDAGMINVQFSKSIRPYLLQEDASSWPLGAILSLSTGYAMRHYMLGKSMQGKGHQHTLTVRQYRECLKLETKYTRFRDLKRRIITPSIKEINEQTDLSMSVDVERIAHQPAVITFRTESASQKQAGKVYVLRALESNYWKVGHTTVSVEERRKAIQTGCPFPLEVFWVTESPDARALEKTFHQCLGDHRAHGEWFSLSEKDMLRAIRALENTWPVRTTRRAPSRD